jgi:predicted nuclease of predicted toxin-antitoxin system
MARLYADENFPLDVVRYLRDRGHDVLTAREVGQAGQKNPDEGVLEFATADDRAVLTLDHWDFHRHYRRDAAHAGIIGCASDANLNRMAAEIDKVITIEIQARGSLAGQYLRVVKPSR